MDEAQFQRLLRELKPLAVVLTVIAFGVWGLFLATVYR